MSDTELKQGDDEWIFFFYLGNCAMTFGYPYGKKNNSSHCTKKLIIGEL